jgi:hypothetical protein
MRAILAVAAVLGALLHLGAVETAIGTRGASLRAQGRGQDMTFFVQGGWAACRRDVEFNILDSIRLVPKRWNAKLALFRRANICTATREDDLVYLGPGGIPKAVEVLFLDRPDISPQVPFYLSFRAVYELPDIGLYWFVEDICYNERACWCEDPRDCP